MHKPTVPTKDLYDTGDHTLQWTVDALGVHDYLEEFRDCLKGKKGDVIAAVRRARALLSVPKPSTLALELFLVNQRSEWLADRSQRMVLLKAEQEVVYKSARQRLLNTLADYRVQPPEGHAAERRGRARQGARGHRAGGEAQGWGCSSWRKSSIL